MSNNGYQCETQETHTADSDIYEPEPRELSREEQPNPTVEAEQSNAQPRVTDVNPAVFIGHTARRLRLKTLVSEFRDEKRSREDTLSEIHGVLNRGPHLSEEEKETTLRLCIEEINSAEERT